MKQSMLKTVLSITFVAAGAMLYASGCMKGAENDPGGGCDPMFDQTNPCTKCVNPMTSERVNFADGTLCSRGPNSGVCKAGSCDLACDDVDASQCTCGALTDCPDVGECQEKGCESGKCRATNKPAETVLDVGTLGDCMGRGCDGAGHVVEAVPVEGDVPADDGDPCTGESCNGGMAIHPLKNEGDGCATTEVPSGFCKSTGATTMECVTCVVGTSTGCPGEICYADSNGKPTCSHCKDNATNGDEMGPDCGGHCGKDCPNGTPCSIDKASECQSNYCVDGVCCNDDCIFQCRQCNPTSGACEMIPPGMDDPVMSCGQGKVCSAAGDCRGLPGAPCSNNSDCVSNMCLNTNPDTCN